MAWVSDAQLQTSSAREAASSENNTTNSLKCCATNWQASHRTLLDRGSEPKIPELFKKEWERQEAYTQVPRPILGSQSDRGTESRGRAGRCCGWACRVEETHGGLENWEKRRSWTNSWNRGNQNCSRRHTREHWWNRKLSFTRSWCWSRSWRRSCFRESWLWWWCTLLTLKIERTRECWMLVGRGWWCWVELRVGGRGIWRKCTTDKIQGDRYQTLGHWAKLLQKDDHGQRRLWSA